MRRYRFADFAIGSAESVLGPATPGRQTDHITGRPRPSRPLTDSGAERLLLHRGRDLGGEIGRILLDALAQREAREARPP